MYAPWYWHSRTTSAVGFAHPLNVIAMEELMGWSMLFPNQVAIYGYPRDWTHGTARRIKFYAKNRIRGVYLNGARGNLLHWVASQLLWDPFLDAEALEKEFVDAFYGPAAGPMKEYLGLQRETIEANSTYTKDVFANPEFVIKARDILNQAEKLALQADLRTQTRIQEAVLDGIYIILQSTHPIQGTLQIKSESSLFIKDFEMYVKLYQLFLNNCKSLGLSKKTINSRINAFRRKMAKLGVEIPKGIETGTSVEMFNSAIAVAINSFERSVRSKDTYTLHPNKLVKVSFDYDREFKKWRVDGSQTDLVTSPKSVTLTAPSGEKRKGIKVSAPLSRLPVLPRGNIEIHVGKFHAEKSFDPPLDVSGCFYLDFHVYASADVPVTIYINNKMQKLRSDVDLHAGEQIVRLDLRNFRSSRHFSYERWNKQITRIAMDIWPQDNIYPYDPVQDTDLILLGMEAKNYDPKPSMLPHKGKAIWMTHFRPNVSNTIKRVISDVSEAYEQLMGKHKKYKQLRPKYGGREEKYRTFTSHRIVSPIFAIISTGNGSAYEKKAADTMQNYLNEIFGVELPINPTGITTNPYHGNMAYIGKKAGLSTGQIKQAELIHVGSEGFVIRSRNGRIAIAGEDASGTLFGVIRFIEDLGVRFSIPGSREKIPDLRDNFLYELYLLDWPFFKKRMIPGGPFLMTQMDAKPFEQKVTSEVEYAIVAEKVASVIKHHAKNGKKEIPTDISAEFSQSPLACYVAAKLLWDPFEDTTRLVRDFKEGMYTILHGQR
jgi:hypothetical protein